MNKVFAYGTLQLADVQIRVVGRELPMSPAALSGYVKEAIEIDGTEYPIATSSQGGHISGKVLLVSGKELAKMDEYETSAYERVQVKLDSGEEAWVYRRPLGRIDG